MLLTSTFPDFSESEALCELSSSGGGDSNDTRSSTPLRGDRFAGWFSSIQATGNTSTSNSNTCNSRCPRASSSSTRSESCPGDDVASATPTTIPSCCSCTSTSSSRSSSPPTLLTREDSDGDRSAKEATACQSSRGGAGGGVEVGADCRATWVSREGASSRMPPHPPVSCSAQPNRGSCYSGGDAAAVGGGASSPRQPCLSSARPGRLRQEGHVFEELLVATSKAVRRGDVVAVERPLIAAQTSRALPWVTACPGCLRHVGNLDVQLMIASGKLSRAEAFRLGSRKVVATAAAGAGPLSMFPKLNMPEAAATEAAAAHGCQTVGGREEDGEECGDRGVCRGAESGVDARLPVLQGLSERFIQPPVPCSGGCGAIYCSQDCRQKSWDSGHSVLCLGLVTDETHPLVQHKVHAITHPELEAPLLLASALLVQAARAVAVECSCRCCSRGCTAATCAVSDIPASNTSSSRTAHDSPFSTGSDADCPSQRALPGQGGHAHPSSTPVPASVTTSAAAASKRKRTSGGSTSDATEVPPVGRCTGSVAATNHPAPGCCCAKRWVEEEATAAAEIMELFPRGWFCESPRREQGSVTAIRESWALLKEALESKFVSGGADGAAAKAVAVAANSEKSALAVAINPDRFPLLLSLQVYELVVGGLAANLMEVEVESPLVEYCEALVTQDASIQHHALQVLEPALAAMEQAELSQDHTFDEDLAETPNVSSSDESNSNSCNSSSKSNCTVIGGDIDSGGKLKSAASATNQADDGRGLERLSWRCVGAARAASRFVPPLSAHALLPAAALRIPHSCTPAVRVPAGDRRSYNAGGGATIGGGGRRGADAEQKQNEPGVATAGAAGWPLTVAMVALRDIPAGAPLSCAWVGAEGTFSTRMAELTEYRRVVVAPPPPLLAPVPPSSPPLPSPSAGRPSEESSPEEGGFEGSGERSGPLLPGRRGCGCSKCIVEDNEGGVRDSEDGSNCSRPSGALVELLLEAARLAVDEDRFDDAFDILQRAARAAPESGEVLYRAGVCAINQGRWSRALRLWREGLALSPDHQELRREAEKYRELAFWTGIPVENIKNTINDTSASSSGGNNTSRCSGSAVVGRGEGKSGHDRTPPLFSALPLPPTSPPQPLLAKTGKEASLFNDRVDSAVPAAAAAAMPVHFFDNAGGQAEFASLEEEEAPDNLDVEFMAGDGEWVCSTRFPPLSSYECAAIVDEAEAKAASAAAAAGRTGAGSSGWGTARHYAVPTTDMAIRELPRALAWFNTAMRTRIGPLVAAAAALGEGVFSPRRRPRRRRRRRSGPLECSLPSETYAQRLSTATATAQKEEEEEEDQEENETSASDISRRIRVHDAFVVRYDAAAQRSLPLHTDQGELSLTISLNSADEYEGGGTWFEGLGRAVRPDEAGHVVVFPGGSTVHGGREVTNGVRYILAVFLYCHGAEEEEDEEEEEQEEGSGS